MHKIGDSLAGRLKRRIVPFVGGTNCELRHCFRKMETEASKEVASRPTAIISLGGGCILALCNREIVRFSNRCALIITSAEIIAERIESDAKSLRSRPRLTSLSSIAEIGKLLSDRHEVYQSVANIQFDTGAKSLKDIAAHIAAWRNNLH